MHLFPNQSRTTSQLAALPHGKAGIVETLNVMRRLVRHAKTDLNLRFLALDIVKDVPPKDFAGEARAIQQWVRNNIRYTRDINDVETLMTPQKLLEIRHGDCDDQSVLAATLMESIGIPTRFVAIGLKTGVYCHVYAQGYINNQWLSVETTEPVAIGWQPRGVTDTIILEN